MTRLHAFRFLRVLMAVAITVVSLPLSVVLPEGPWHVRSAFAAATASIADVSQAEGQAGTSIMTFTVSLTEPAPVGGVTFNIATSNFSASAPSDYIARSLVGQLIPEGQSSYTFDVTINGDFNDEGNETFLVSVSSLVGATAGDLQASGTILDDDNRFINIGNVSQAEGQAGTSVMSFPVTLTEPAPVGGVTFNIATSNFSASAPSDYIAKSLVAQVIPEGQSSYTFEVTINGDTNDEGDERFDVTISAVVGASTPGSDLTASGFILDDDNRFINIGNVSQAEGQAGTSVMSFPVTLTEPAPVGGVTFNIATSNFSASAPSDYIAKSLVGQVIAFKGAGFGVTNTICGLPGFSTLSGSSLGQALAAVEAALAPLAQLGGLQAYKPEAWLE